MTKDDSAQHLTVVYSTQLLATKDKSDDLVLTVNESPLAAKPNNTSDFLSSNVGDAQQWFSSAIFPPEYHFQSQPYSYKEGFQYMETYMEANAFGHMRGKSLEGFDIETSVGSNHRLLDVHNLDAPSYFMPLSHIGNNRNHSIGCISSRRNKGSSFGEKISYRIHNMKKSPKATKSDALRRIAEAETSIAVAEAAHEQLYPIYLPMDQEEFKSKYLFTTRKKRGKTVQEKTYHFLEHPYGWACFTYHFTV